MKKFILSLCIAVVTVQNLYAEDLDFLNSDVEKLDFKIKAEPKKESVAFKDVPKIAALYAYYTYLKPFLIAVKIMEDEEIVA